MLWILFGCPRAISPALEVDPATPVAEAVEPADPAASLAWMIGSDPLVRRPRLPEKAPPSGLDPFLAVARRDSALPKDWWEAESTSPGTLTVPFARGARLAQLETALATPAEALDWVLPLAPPVTAAVEQVRGPLAWIDAEKVDSLLVVVERQVLLGWLDGPGIDLAPAAAALAVPTYDRVALTPAGRLVVARAAGPRDAAAGAAGAARLEEATWLALRAAAAHRDAEQAAYREIVRERAVRWGDDPLDALLGGAETELLRDAGSEASTARALLAIAARRWSDSCPDAPCGGFDRVTSMAAVARWDPGVEALADVWRVIALESAVDRLEVAYERPTFPDALDDVVEALLGTGAAGLDRGLLLRPRPDVTMQLTLTRAVGGGDLTGRDDLFRALEDRVRELARSAATRAPARMAEPLGRIARR